MDNAFYPFPGNPHILHDFFLCGVGLRLLDKEGIVLSIQKGEEGAGLGMVCHVNAHILGYGAGHNHPIPVNDMELVHIEQVGQILHFPYVQGNVFLPVKYVFGCLCTCQVVFI